MAHRGALLAEGVELAYRIGAITQVEVGKSEAQACLREVRLHLQGLLVMIHSLFELTDIGQGCP